MDDVALSELETEAWSGLLHVHSALWAELERRLVDRHGLQLSSYDVLLKLDRAGSDGLRMSDLARRVLMSSGGVTRLVERLERTGLIARAPSEADGRGTVARLTPAGRRLLARARRGHLADVRELVLDHLGERQLQALVGVWRRLAATNPGLVS